MIKVGAAAPHQKRLSMKKLSWRVVQINEGIGLALASGFDKLGSPALKKIEFEK
jgi:hypothetical protein